MEGEIESVMDSNFVKDWVNVAKADVAPIHLPWPVDSVLAWSHFDMLEQVPNHTSARRRILEIAWFLEVPVNLRFVVDMVDMMVSGSSPVLGWASMVLPTHYLSRYLEAVKDFGVCDHEDRGSNQRQ